MALKQSMSLPGRSKPTSGPMSHGARLGGAALTPRARPMEPTPDAATVPVSTMPTVWFQPSDPAIQVTVGAAADGSVVRGERHGGSAVAAAAAAAEFTTSVLLRSGIAAPFKASLPSQYCSLKWSSASMCGCRNGSNHTCPPPARDFCTPQSGVCGITIYWEIRAPVGYVS